MAEAITDAQRKHLSELENKRTNTHREDEWRDIVQAMIRNGAEALLLRRAGALGSGAALDELAIIGRALDRHASNFRKLHQALGDTSAHGHSQIGNDFTGDDLMLLAAGRMWAMQQEIERLGREVERLDRLSDDLHKSKAEAIKSHQEARDRALVAERKVRILRCAVRELVDQAEDVPVGSGG